MTNISRTINAAADELRRQRRVVRHSFQPRPEDVDILTPKEQTERFLNLSPDELLALRTKWGDIELNKYIKTQMRMLLGMQNAS